MRPDKHVFVCTNRRPPGSDMPSCGPNGGGDVLAAFLRERAERGLVRIVYVTQAQCLGVCPRAGATVVVYPDATWYVGVNDGDVAEIFREHLLDNRPVERLLDPRYR